MQGLCAGVRDHLDFVLNLAFDPVNPQSQEARKRMKNIIMTRIFSILKSLKTQQPRTIKEPQETGSVSKEDGTKEFAKIRARRHVGESGKIYLARSEGVFKGPIMELTPTHLIQKTHHDTVMLHLREDLATASKEEQKLLEAGQSVKIAKHRTGIAKNKVKVTITLWDKGRKSPAV